MKYEANLYSGKDKKYIFLENIVFTLNIQTNMSEQTAEHYENMPVQIYRKFHLQKSENFQIKNSDIFHIYIQNIDCWYSLELPRRGGSNEYPQSVFFFFSRNKINVYPCKPQIYYTKVGFKGGQNNIGVFS